MSPGARSWMASTLLGSALLLAAGPSRAEELVFRMDEATAVAGLPFTVRGTFAPANQVAKARVRYRPKGETDYQPVDLVRADSDSRPDVWEAEIPARAVKEAGLEYFIVAQTTAGKALVVHGSAKQPILVKVSAPLAAPEHPAGGDAVNPLETAEERELRTGERAGGGTLGAAAAGPVRRTRAQPTDLKVEDAGALTDPTRLQEEFAVFAAEDATAIAATYAQSTRQAPGIITVYTRSRIEQMGARTLLDILKVIPGFETSKTVLGFDEVSIRGIRSDPELLLLIDGHRVANIYDGRIPWAIPVDIIERVEVIRGPGSALYGTGAFLGVVNVVTREREYVRVRAGMSLLKPSPYMLDGKQTMLPQIREANPYNPDDPWNPGGPYNPDNDPGALGLFAPEGSIAGGGKFSWVKAYGSAYARASRGQRSPVATDSFSDTGLTRGVTAMQTDARNATASMTGKVDVAPPFLHGGHAFGRTFLYWEDRGPYFGVFDSLGPRSQLRWFIGTADVGYAQPFGDGGEASVRLYADGHWVDRRLQLSPDGFTTVDRNGDGNAELWPHGILARNVYISTTEGAEARLLLPRLFRHRPVMGMVAEFNAIPHFRYSVNRDENGVALEGLRRPPLDTLEQNQNHAWRLSSALYIQDEWQVWERIYATVGLRANFLYDTKWRTDFFSHPGEQASRVGTDAAAIPSDPDRLFGTWDPRTHITPRVGLVVEPIDDLAFKLLYGAAYRDPTFEEKYDKTSQSYADFSAGVFIGNAQLEPEYIHTAESGVDWLFNLGPFKHRVAANAFYSFIGNSIDRIDESGSQEPIRNRGFRHVMGFESELRVEFAPNTYVYGNVSWHRGWFVEPEASSQPNWTNPASYLDAARNVKDSPNPDNTKVSYLTTVPQYRANAGANVELVEFVTLHGDVMLGSERRNNVRSTLERLRSFSVPAYALLNLGMRTRPVFGWVGFEGNVSNALDYNYRDDVPRPDRVPELLPREGTTVLFGIYMDH